MIDRLRLSLILIMLAVLAQLWPASVAATENEIGKTLQLLVKAIDSKLGDEAVFAASIFDVQSGDEVFSHNAKMPLIPASVAKLFTSYTALKELGPDFQFQTEIYVGHFPNADRGDVGVLYVRGSGDPSFVNERMQELGIELKARGVRKVEKIVVDDGLFLEPPQAIGARAYETGLSAAAVNFNSVAFHILPGALGEKPLVEHTPLGKSVLWNNLQTVTGNGAEIRADVQPGPLGLRLMVEGTIGAQSPLLTVHRSMPESALYFANVLSAHLEKQGILVSKFGERGVVPGDAMLLTKSTSKELALIVRDLNHYSNNFIAGQLLFALGRDSAGLCRAERGLARIQDRMIELGLPVEQLHLVDGSGLSRDNRVSALALAKMLAHAHRDLSVFPDFLASLSRFGHSGTLKTRQLSAANESRNGPFRLRDAVWGKTGSLGDVSSLAGYAESSSGKLYAFALLTNGKLKKEEIVQFENSFVERIIGYGQGEIPKQPGSR